MLKKPKDILLSEGNTLYHAEYCECGHQSEVLIGAAISMRENYANTVLKFPKEDDRIISFHKSIYLVIA